MTGSIPASLWGAAFLISLSSLLFGYSMSSLNNVLALGEEKDPHKCYVGRDLTCPQGSILNDLDLNNTVQQVATAMTILGAMIGGLLASYPNDHLGRRKSLLLNNGFFLVGGSLCGIPQTSYLLIGRFMVGLGTGVESMIAPVLLSEIASPESRGAITSLHQLMITIGILLTAVISYPLVNSVKSGWRVVQFFIMLPAAIQVVVGLVYPTLLPESPRWLIRQGRRWEAKSLLVQLRDRHTDVEEEIAEIQHLLLGHNRHHSPVRHNSSSKDHHDSNEDGGIVEGDAHNTHCTWKETFSYTRAMQIGMLMMFFSAMTGINTVIFYSTRIFDLAGVHDAIKGTLAVDILNVFLTILSGYLVDKAGRKILLTTGTWLMMASLIVLGTTLWFMTSPSTSRSIISVGCVLLYVSGFAIGLGAVQWVVVGEVVPTKIRSKAYSLFVTSNWTANLIISLTTLSLIDALGGYNKSLSDEAKQSAEQRGVSILYLMFAGVCALCLSFLYGMVPETKGTSERDHHHHHHYHTSHDHNRRPPSPEKPLLSGGVPELDVSV